MVSTQTTDKCHRCKTHVPLTDEDVNEVIAGCYGYSADFEFHQCLVRAIERAHGIGEEK